MARNAGLLLVLGIALGAGCDDGKKKGADAGAQDTSAGDGSVEMDAGVPPDAGEIAADAGGGIEDGGEMLLDAGGAASDGGEAALDAGEPTPDSGEPASDAGEAAADGGEISSDAGEAPPDGGVLHTACSSGNSHVATFDGLLYDFRAAGEFVLLSDARGRIVQVRQQPWGTSPSMAVITAVATRVGTQRVGIYAGSASGAGLSVKVDGVVRTPSSPVAIGGGGSVARDGELVTITYPDGEQLQARHDLDNLVITYLPPSRIRQAVGLCGNANLTPDDDLAASSGSNLARPPSRGELYADYGSSLRVTQDGSLFDYAQGESAASFADAAFPTADGSPSRLESAAVDADIAQCTSAQVADPLKQSACLFDVAATGQARFTGFAAGLPTLEGRSMSGYYFTDFEAAPGSAWSSAATSRSTGGSRPATSYLGPLASSEVHLALSHLPFHNRVRVDFDLVVIGGWKQSRWSFASGGHVLLDTTFTVGEGTQAYPDQFGSGSHPANTGAAATNALGGASSDAVYRLSFTFLHFLPQLDVAFKGTSLPSGATWGLDNVEVSLESDPGVTIEQVPGTGDTVVHGKEGEPAVVGCSDGRREAFLDQARYPTIAGCIASWAGTKSLRAAATGKACGDGLGACDVPADACGPGWHPCGASGLVAELRDRVTPADCEGAGGGRFVAAISHCKTQSSCVYDLTAEATYACFATGWCSEAVCCGSQCQQFGACTGGLWANRTHIAQGTDQGCGAITASRAGGILCCKEASAGPEPSASSAR